MDDILDQTPGIGGKGKGYPVAQARVDGVGLESGSLDALEGPTEFLQLKGQITLQDRREVILGLVLGDGKIALEFVDAGRPGVVAQKKTARLRKLATSRISWRVTMSR